jgi:thiol-disulfide isomerase/thioredoxin
MMKKLIYITLVIAVVGVAASYIHFRINTKTTTEVFGLINKELPAFNLADVNGNSVSLGHLKGKPVVINLWFTTCRPCLQEIPLLNRIKAETQEDVVFLAMALDEPTVINRFLLKKPYNFTIIPSATAYIESITSSFPTTLFVDRGGVVRDVKMGIPLTDKPLDVANTEFINSFHASIKKIL